MSRTQRPSSRKIVHRLEEGEVFVAGPAYAFETLIEVATAFSTMPEYTSEQRADWAATAEWLRGWVDTTTWEPDDWN